MRMPLPCTPQPCCRVLPAARHSQACTTPAQGVGYTLSLAGFFLYNYIKMQKGPPAMAPGPPGRRVANGDYISVSTKDADGQKGEV